MRPTVFQYQYWSRAAEAMMAAVAISHRVPAPGGTPGISAATTPASAPAPGP